MKIRLFIILLLTGIVYGQQDSITVKNASSEKEETVFPDRNLYDRLWAPALLTTMSITTSLDSTKFGLQELIRRPFEDNFHTKADDFLLWGPTVMMYSADLLGVESRNSMWQQTKFLAISGALTTAIMLTLKYSLKIERPNGTEFDSYPSGHTSLAFCQAQVFYNEFRDTHPVFASTAYLFAVSTGTLRVLNNRHWVPDVLLGAGIGILAANLVYHFEPLKNWNPFKNRKNKKSEMMLVPSVGQDYYGLRFRLGL